MTSVPGLIQNKNKNYKDIAISEKGVIVTNQKNHCKQVEWLLC